MDFGYRKIQTSDEKNIALELYELFSDQPLAVLSTQGEGQPFSNLIAFVSTEDLKNIIFATTRSTRKFTNIGKEPRVSFLIDNRSNEVDDFHKAMAVTATGKAYEIRSEDKVVFLKLYLKKHPHLEDFVMSPTCALIRVDVDSYYITKHFQNVLVLNIKK